jgi:hypothetical protein
LALSARANTAAGAAVSASPATTLRLVIKFKIVRAIITSMTMAQSKHAVCGERRLLSRKGPPGGTLLLMD